MAKKTKVTLFNDFHGTEVNVFVFFSTSGSAYLTERQAQHVRKELCGCDGCGCKTVKGVRSNGVHDTARAVTEYWDHAEQCETYMIYIK